MITNKIMSNIKCHRDNAFSFCNWIFYRKMARIVDTVDWIDPEIFNNINMLSKHCVRSLTRSMHLMAFDAFKILSSVFFSNVMLFTRGEPLHTKGENARTCIVCMRVSTYVRVESIISYIIRHLSHMHRRLFYVLCQSYNIYVSLHIHI